jgi:hypothetical protein
MARLTLAAVFTLFLLNDSAFGADASPSACASCPHSAKAGQTSACSKCDGKSKCEENSQCQGSSCKHALLREKLAELERLQKEIADLRQALLSGRQFVIKVELLEIDRQRAREAGFDLEPQSKTDAESPNQPMTDPILVSTLKENGFARVLSEPTIITTSDCQACFFSGSEVPVPGDDGKVEAQEVGTHLDVLPTDLGDNRVRLAIQCKFSDLEREPRCGADGKCAPTVEVRQCDTVCEMALGQTLAFMGLPCRHSCNCKGASETAMAVLVTADSAERSDTPVKTAARCEEAACAK